MGEKTRRKYLHLISTGVVTGIAGCANTSNSDMESTTATDTELATKISPTESPTTPQTPTATTTPPPETPTWTPTPTQTTTTSTTSTGPPRTALSVSRNSTDQSTVYFDVKFEIPSAVSGVAIDVYYAVVNSSHGFEKQNDNRYVWDGETSSPSLSLVVDIDAISRTAYDNTYAATTSWVFGPTPFIRLWWYTENDWTSVRPLIDSDYDRVSISRSSPGVVGGGFFYLGPYESYTTDNSGQVLHLVVPDEATLVDSPSTFLNAIANASQYLVGTPHKSVLIFSLPDPIRDGGLAKPKAGEFWVHAKSQLQVPESNWFHEYIHLRQQYTTKTQMQWVGEASADYYATLFAYVQNLISERTAYNHFTESEYKSAVLSEPSSWTSKRVPYSKGESVLYVLDKKIREQTGDKSWLGNVSYQMNQLDNPVSYRSFRSIVVNIAGPKLGNWVDKYVTTSAWPDSLK